MILVNAQELHLIQGSLAGKLQIEMETELLSGSRQHVSELPTFGIIKSTKVKKAESFVNAQTGKFS